MHSRLLALMCLSFAFAACGSTDTSTPMAGCNSVATAACNKAVSCNSLPAGETQAQCVTATEATLECATISCGTGTTYSSGAVSQCINDINGLTCPVTAAPASCDTSLFCTGG